MTKKAFKEIIEKYLLPLFPGMEIKGFVASPKKKSRHATLMERSGNCSLKVVPSLHSKYCLSISRSQLFSSAEIELIDCFLKSAENISLTKNKIYNNELYKLTLTKTIAASFGKNSEGFLYDLLVTMGEWAQQTYEGQKISFSVGIEIGNKYKSEISFTSIANEEFLKVLSNGYDSLLVFNEKGFLLRQDICAPPEKNVLATLAIPIAFKNIAAWTIENPKRIVITLNRHGDILLFKEGEIVFSKRRGQWRYFSHAAFLKQFTESVIAKSSNAELLHHLYLTALDVAFSRTGGCIGFILKSHINKFNLIPQEKRLTYGNKAPHTARLMALNAIVEGKKFQDIERQIRLELVSIDGATVLDYEGNFIAAGAILELNETSLDGGGRQSAAEALSNFGLGIKISNDGYIRVLNRDKNKKTPLIEIG